MNNTSLSTFADQIEALLEEYRSLRPKSKHDDLSDLGTHLGFNLLSRFRSVISRATLPHSTFRIQSNEILSAKSSPFPQLTKLVGVAEGLLIDIRSGHMDNISDLIHADVFGDFLEMAEHLLTEGYKDASAVLAGGSLEAHLRALCIKNGIAVERSTAAGIKPKKADALNSELHSANVITGLEQKNITSWLALRNKAAHGHYAEYSKEHVELYLAGIRQFLSQFPA